MVRHNSHLKGFFIHHALLVTLCKFGIAMQAFLHYVKLIWTRLFVTCFSVYRANTWYTSAVCFSSCLYDVRQNWNLHFVTRNASLAVWLFINGRWFVLIWNLAYIVIMVLLTLYKQTSTCYMPYHSELLVTYSRHRVGIITAFPSSYCCKIFRLLVALPSRLLYIRGGLYF